MTTEDSPSPRPAEPKAQGAYSRVVLHRFGGPDGFEVVRGGALPVPAAGQVRVRTLAASVQFTDVIIRKGQYPDLKEKPPFTPGYDTVGEVDALGEGVTTSLLELTPKLVR